MKIFEAHTANLRKIYLSLALILLLPVFIFACAKTPVNYTRPGTPNAANITAGRPDLNSAQAAYSRGNTAEARVIAEAFLKTSPEDITEKIAAWRIIAMVSSEQIQPQATLYALENWQTLSAEAKTQDDWLTLWSTALTRLPYDEARPIAASAATNQNNPWQLQLEAALFIQENRLRANLLDGLPAELEKIYADAHFAVTRKNLEQRLFRQMHRASALTVATLAKQVNETNEKKYPYALFRLEEARRMFLDTRTQELSREMVAFLKSDSLLADQSLFNTWIDPDLSILDKFTVNSSHLALVLPLSGQYGNLAEKIATGVEIARKGFASNGHTVQIHVIDSDQPGWVQQLALLPPEVQLVGGPLRYSDYLEIKAAGELSRRKFFTFLRTLNGADEGKIAWRFFNSDADQLKAVIRFSSNLGINYFGALAPEEDYGARMLTLFGEQLTTHGARLSKFSTYPANQHQDWNKLVATFLNTTKEAEFSPPTPFQALFIPDSWQNATILIPHFFYYREHRQIFMGTMLWEQEISMQKQGESNPSRMIIFPGAWDMQSINPSSMILRTYMAAEGKEPPDFWISLGYDFANFAAALPMAQNASASDINLSLTTHTDIPWSGAPIIWDNNGMASQELFIFTPAEQGFVLADPAKFRNYYSRAWKNHFVKPADAPETAKIPVFAPERPNATPSASPNASPEQSPKESPTESPTESPDEQIED